MIDPFNITDYNRTQEQLEELLLFCVAVPGHNAKTTAVALEKLLQKRPPFELIRSITGGPPTQEAGESFLHFGVRSILGIARLRAAVKDAGIGCYTRVSRSFWEAAYSRLELTTCSVEDLEKIHGIAMKTSRFFLLASRRGARVAALDVHVLAHLRSLGHDVPSSTPASPKQYTRIEALVLQEVDRSGKTPAEYDLDVWKKGAGR